MHGGLRRLYALARATFAHVDPGKYTDTELRSWGAAHEWLWRALRLQGIEVQVVVIGADYTATIRAEAALKTWSSRAGEQSSQRDMDHRSGVCEPGDPAEPSRPHPLSYGHPSEPSRYLFGDYNDYLADAITAGARRRRTPVPTSTPTTCATRRPRSRPGPTVPRTSPRPPPEGARSLRAWTPARHTGCRCAPPTPRATAAGRLRGPGRPIRRTTPRPPAIRRSRGRRRWG